LIEYIGPKNKEEEKQIDWNENPNLFQIHKYSFDYVFDMETSQKNVYEYTAKPAVISILEGYNSTIIAYGQTGTGKTYTMEGNTYSRNDKYRGIIPRSIEEIFNHIESFSKNESKFMVRASYLQIYNEGISDLLKPENINLVIREDKKKGVFVENLSEWVVRSPVDIYNLLKRGSSFRATSATKMNDISSRSHAVFMIIVEQLKIVNNHNEEPLTQIKIGKLNLVDLAGSERIKFTGAIGKQLEESKNINKSLSALGNVIYALTEKKGRTHIPYRDSKVKKMNLMCINKYCS
jgi:kinesin family protein 3/17